MPLSGVVVFVLVLVLKYVVLKDKFKILVLGAQVLVLVLVLDTQVLLLVLEEKSLVVSLFLVFLWHLRSRFLRNLTSVYTEISISICIYVNEWNAPECFDDILSISSRIF